MTAALRLLVALIVAATAAFVVGVAIERNQPANEAAQASGGKAETPSERATESGEGVGEAGAHSDEGTSAEAGGASGSSERGHTDSSEALLGVNPESTGLVAVAVVVSLLLAFAVWRAPGVWWLLGAVALTMAVFAALDVREALHQANESRTGLTLLAGAVAGLHLAAALLAASGALAVCRSGSPPAPSRHVIT